MTNVLHRAAQWKPGIEDILASGLRIFALEHERMSEDSNSVSNDTSVFGAKKVLFSARIKTARHLFDVYEQKDLRIQDLDFIQSFHFVRPLRAGWIDSTKDRKAIRSYSYILETIAPILKYRTWLKLCMTAERSKFFLLVRKADNFIFNIHCLLLMVFGKFDYFFYYDRVYRITERILLLFRKTVIEYDGRPLNVSHRDFSKEIAHSSKFLVSNMDRSKLIGQNRHNFFQIHLGISSKIGPDQMKTFSKRPIDVLLIGRMTPDAFKTRCDLVEALVANLGEGLNIVLHGDSAGLCDKYPKLKALNITPLYGPKLIDLFSKAKIGLVIPADEHLADGSGVPTRVFENAVFGVTQLVYDGKGMASIGFEDGTHFLSFQNEKELEKKIRYLLDNPAAADRIRASAGDYYYSHLTGEKQMSRLLFKVMRAEKEAALDEGRDG